MPRKGGIDSKVEKGEGIKSGNERRKAKLKGIVGFCWFQVKKTKTPM